MGSLRGRLRNLERAVEDETDQGVDSALAHVDADVVNLWGAGDTLAHRLQEG
jgi:hypothetical protein